MFINNEIYIIPVTLGWLKSMHSCFERTKKPISIWIFHKLYYLGVLHIVHGPEIVILVFNVSWTRLIPIIQMYEIVGIHDGFIFKTIWGNFKIQDGSNSKVFHDHTGVFQRF